MKVLLAEDDKFIREGLVEILRHEGYRVVPACDGESALRLFESESPDFVCLDIMMPKASGYDVCRCMRAARPLVPIIFISAKSEEIDKVVGLELGADDFIVKPFGVKEVVARIPGGHAAMRRGGGDTNGRSRFGWTTWRCFPPNCVRVRGQMTIDLSLRDVKILELFHRRRGQVLDRNTIFNDCWGEDYLPNSRTLDQHISQLRKRIEVSPKEPKLIRTVHGAGYRFEG